MNLRCIEITVFIITIFATLLLVIFRNRFKEKHKNTYYNITAITALIGAFIGIHFFFCYQIGFPASVTQDNGSDLTLTASDWLAFLGGYLGFAGSLLMAFLVFRQNETINRLTLSEYKPSASLVIQKSVKSTEFHKENENFDLTAIIQNIPGRKKEEYYSYHCATVTDMNIAYENFAILVFVEIINNSKAPINNLSFNSLEIKEVKNENKCMKYLNRGEEYDPADGCTDILPGRALKRCFLIELIPKEIKTSWLTFNFLYGDNVPFSPQVLVAKTEGNALLLINASEQIG